MAFGVLNYTGLKATSVREEDYGLGTAWLVPVSVCQSGEPGSSGGRQIKQEEAGREILSGNSGGGEKEPHAPFSL